MKNSSFSIEQAVSAFDGKNDSKTTAGTAELEYLTEMIPQLRLMALGLNQQTLAYLLELSMIEARLQLDATEFEESVVEGDEIT